MAVARTNAERLLPNQPVQLIEGDLLQEADWDLFPTIDILISNPPYIPQHERSLMPEVVLAHEPALALFVPDDDPLLFYHALGRFASQKLIPGGAFFFECNEFNVPEVAQLLTNFGLKEITLRRDVADKQRMVSGRK